MTKMDRDKILHYQKGFDKMYKNMSEIELINRGEKIIEDEMELYQDNSTRSVRRRWSYPIFCEHIYSNLDLQPGNKILVVGCGCGFDQKNIAKQYAGIECSGIDISTVMITMAKKAKTPGALAVAIGEELPFPNNCFDRVLAREVIEHVMDPTAFMSEIFRVLKDDGRTVIATPNGNSLAFAHILHRVEKFLNRRALPPTPSLEDVLGFREILDIFKNSNFRLKKVVFDGALYFWLSSFPDRLSFLFFPIANAVRFAEGLPYLNKLLCDQVKFALEKYTRDSKEGESACNDNEPHWVCPHCKGELEINESPDRMLSCSVCKCEYAIKDDIPNFLADNTTDIVTENSVVNSPLGMPPVLRSILSWVITISYSLIYVFTFVFILPFSLASLLIEKNKYLKHFRRI